MLNVVDHTTRLKLLNQVKESYEIVGISKIAMKELCIIVDISI